MIDLLLTAAAVIYVWAVVLLSVFVGSFGVLLAIYFRTRNRVPVLPQVDDWPSVTIQLPIYNEAHVVARLVDACAQLDYPPDRLHIQLIDDSTDETTAILRQKVAEWAGRGMRHIGLIRRPARTGYKAGALAYGMRFIQTEYVVVFDADAVPPRDFLRLTMPYFRSRDDLALVQTRWDHLNAGHNALTRAQALTMDNHFAIEQVARCRGRLPRAMNGSGGIWRVAALEDAGGWSSATVTEDLDLSYRALLRGWDFLYLPGVAVPGELPPQVQAYKVQQQRWATGMTECLIRHAVPLLRSHRFHAGQKFMGLMHLAQYAVQPVILLIFLLTPLLLWGGMFPRLPDLGLLGAVGIIPPLMMAVAQHALHPDWARRLLLIPVQAALGAGLVLNNTLGVLAAFHRPGVQREFRRTPKFNATRWRGSRYALRIDGVTLGEIALGCYAVWGLVLALRTLPALAIYMASYAISFFLCAGWNIVQMRGHSSRTTRTVLDRMRAIRAAK